MSRIGKQLTTIPEGVTVSEAGGVLTVKGPKGELKRALHDAIHVIIEDNTVRIEVNNPEDKPTRSLWGTFGSHVKNMITGVTEGFSKELEVNGVGYRVAMQGNDVKLEVGFSHPVLFALPQGVQAQVEKNVIKLTSADKELLGVTAAKMRAIRKPEPYKGKGIKYIDEHIRRKAGKTAAKGE